MVTPAWWPGLHLDQTTQRGGSHATTNVGPLDITFTATLGRVCDGETSTCLQMADSASVFGPRDLAKVAGTVHGVAFRSSSKAFGDGTLKLPIGAAIRKADGDHIVIQLEQHLSRYRHDPAFGGTDRSVIQGGGGAARHSRIRDTCMTGWRLVKSGTSPRFVGRGRVIAACRASADSK